jgi:hypothetical protein
MSPKLAEAYRYLITEYSKLSWFALAVLIISFVPDWHGRLVWWYAAVVWLLKHLASPYGRTGLVLVCAVLIWLDHRRVLQKRQSQLHDEMPASQAKPNLPDRVAELAKNIFRFLHDCGAQEIPSLTYVIKVNSGFMLYWFSHVERIEHELGFHGIWAYELGELIRLYRYAWSYDSIRKIAEALLEIKNKMELNEYKDLPITQKEIDRMSAKELRDHLEKDPDFYKQVTMLEAFKRPS